MVMIMLLLRITNGRSWLSNISCLHVLGPLKLPTIICVAGVGVEVDVYNKNNVIYN